jgi:hypothetical protein
LAGYGIVAAAAFTSLSAWATPYTTTRYVKIDTVGMTGFIFDESFNQLPTSPFRPDTSGENLPNTVQWLLGVDADVVRRESTGAVKVLSKDPRYSQLPHHVIWKYMNSSRPDKDPCGILPFAQSRDLLALRFPAGYAYKMQGGNLGLYDFHWTNSDNVPDNGDLYVRVVMHWDDDNSGGYRDMNVTWVGLNPCYEEVDFAPGKTDLTGPAYNLNQRARVVAVAPHTKDHANFIELIDTKGSDSNGKPDVLFHVDPVHYPSPSAHYGSPNRMDPPTVPWHRSEEHIPVDGLYLWLPGERGPILEPDDKLTSHIVMNNPHDAAVENSSIFLVYWEPLGLPKGPITPPSPPPPGGMTMTGSAAGKDAAK